MEGKLQIEERPAVLGVRLDLIGEVDCYTSPRLKRELRRALEEGHKDLAVDLTGVDYLDSTGIGVLLGVLRDVKKAEGTLTLLNPRGQVAQVLSRMGMDRLLTVEHEQRQAA